MSTDARCARLVLRVHDRRSRDVVSRPDTVKTIPKMLAEAKALGVEVREAKQ